MNLNHDHGRKDEKPHHSPLLPQPNLKNEHSQPEKKSVGVVGGNGYVERPSKEAIILALRTELQAAREVALTAREEAWQERQHRETALRFLAAYSAQGFQAYLRETA